MGRSVSYPSGAYVTFAETPDEGQWCAACGEHVEDEACACDLSDWHAYEALSDEYAGNEEALAALDEVEDPRDWRDVELDWRQACEDWSEQARRLWPSMWDADDWRGREDHVIARNRLADFGVSEYCGLMAFWLVPRNEAPEALAERWCAQAFAKLESEFGTLRKRGHMSNGCGVYSRIEAAAC